MKRALRWLIVLAVLVGGIVVLRLTLFRPQPVPVAVVAVEPGRVEDTVTNSRGGTVETRRRASLSPEVDGRVADLRVTEGDRVEPGEVLLRLDDRVLRSEVTLRERSLETSRATERQTCLEADQAERELVRYRELFATDLVSPETLDQFQSRRDIAAAACDRGRAAVGESRAALDASRTRLDKTVLTAPFAGIVAEVRAEVGEYIAPSPPGVYIPPVIDLIDPDDLYVKAPIDEIDVGKVQLELPVRILMDPFPDRSFAGRVTRVAPYVLDLEKQNRTFDVEVDFDPGEQPGSILPGASADVEIILEAREDVLRIPRSALIEGDQVLLLRDEHLVAVPVEVGLRNYAYAEIAGGLEKGDRVVISADRTEIRDGAYAVAEDETTP